MVQRRTFLAAANAAIWFPRITFAQGQTDVLSHQLLQGTVASAVAENALIPIITMAAARTASNPLSQSQSDKLIADYSKLAHDVRTASTGAQLTKLLVSSEARRLGVADAVETGIAEHRLVAAAAGFFGTYNPNALSTVQQVSNAMLQALQANGANSSRAFDVIGAVAGWAPGSAPKDLAAILPPNIGAVGGAIVQMWSAGQLTTANVEVLCKGVAGAAFMRMTNLDLGKLAQGAPAVPPPTGTDNFLFKYGSESEDLRVGAAAIYGVLSLLPNGQSEQLMNAAKYAQSAVQVYQSAMLLASMASGWGMVSVAGTLLSGVGGLGAFGGLAGDSGAAASEAAAKARHEQLMSALKDLRKEMFNQFSHINSKMDFITKQLGTVLQQLESYRGQMNTLLENVATVERRVDYLSVRTDQAFLRQAIHTHEDRTIACENTLKYRQPVNDNRLLSCRKIYATLAARASADPFMSVPLSLEDAYIQLTSSFGAGTGERNKVAQEKASCISYVFINEWGKPLPGKPAYGSLLQEAMTSYASWRRENLALFDKFSVGAGKQDVARQIWDIRDAVTNHHLFLEALRDTTSKEPKKHLVFSPIFDAYQESIDDFQKQLTALSDEGCKAVVEGTVNRKPPKGYRLKIKSIYLNSPATPMPVAREDAFGVDGISPQFIAPHLPAEHVNDYFSIFAETLDLNQTYAEAKALAAASPAFDHAIFTKPILRMAVEYFGSILFRFDAILPDFSVGLLSSSESEFAALFNGRTVRDPLAFFNSFTISLDYDAAANPPAFTFSFSKEVIQGLVAVQPQYLEALRNYQFVRCRMDYEFYMRMLQEKLKPLFKLGRTAVLPKVPALTRFEQLCCLLRAVCLLGHEDAALNNNALQSLLYGSNGQAMPSGMVDYDILKAWANGKAFEVPKAGTTITTALHNFPPAALARVRLNIELNEALQQVIESTERRGESFSFAKARAEFEEMFPISTFPRTNIYQA
jgi:hypothetical protein